MTTSFPLIVPASMAVCASTIWSRRYTCAIGTVTRPACTRSMGVEADVQRAVRRLEHLGDGAQRPPIEGARERDHPRGRQPGVLGVAAVVGTAHALHQSGHLLSRPELRAWAGLHHASRFDPEDPGPGHPRLGGERVVP